jgi:hypothetical protein
MLLLRLKSFSERGDGKTAASTIPDPIVPLSTRVKSRPQQHTKKLAATRGHAVKREHRRLTSRASWAAAGMAVRSPVGSVQSHKRRFARGTGMRKDP